MLSWSTLLVLFPLVSAFPLEHWDTTTACGQFDTIHQDPYSLSTNHWGLGLSNAITGSQCSTLHSVVSDTATWSTQWNWSGGNHIKSFSNIELAKGINEQLSAISSMPSVWKWSQNSSGKVVADVTYDLFTSHAANGSNVNELMVWLATFDAGPISYDYDANGQAVAIVCNLKIVDHIWNLYKGWNGYNMVYSFLPVQGPINSFDGDVYHFFLYLIENNYISSSEYLITAQAGTEATSGAATFTTSAYSLSINTE